MDGRTEREGEARERRRGIAALLVCAAAVAARLYLSWRAPASYDMKWYWSRISDDVAGGARLYADTPYHFSPVWAWLLLLFRRAQAGIPFDALLRTFLTCVDAVSAWLLFRIARREKPAGGAWLPPVLFLANPVSVWVSSVQGQFDNLAILFLLAAILVTRENAEAAAPESGRRAGWFLFLSLAAKQVTLFHPLLWLRRKGGVATV